MLLGIPYRRGMLPTLKRRSGIKCPHFEQEQARNVKISFRMLLHALKISHNISQTCRFRVNSLSLPLLQNTRSRQSHLTEHGPQRRSKPANDGC